MQGSASTRVLLVTASDEEAESFSAALRAGGAETRRVGATCDAAELLQRQAFDAVVLSHPLPDADVIGSCATLAQVPAAPPIVLLDVIDVTAAVESTVPSEMRPKRILVKPIDAAKLPALVREVLDLGDAADSERQPGFDRLAQLLVGLNRQGRTGTLEVRSDGVVTRLHFENGLAIAAEGGSLRETLGRMLLRKGSLSEADYVRVIERMTEQIIDNEPIRMGEALVELGLLSTGDVHAALSEQVAEKITACFQWRAANFEFEEMDEPPPGIEGFDIPPIETLVLRGLKLHVPAEEVVECLARHGQQRVRLTRPASEVMSRFQIGPPHTPLLNALDGSRTVETLLRGDADAWLLSALLWTDSAGFDAGGSETAKKNAPDRPAPQPRPEFAREVVMPRKKATAPPAPGPAPVDESKAKLEAEQVFRRAQDRLKAERFAEALKLMARVVELQPNEPEYRMLEAWAAYLHARVEVRVARAKAVACARRVAEADPQAAKPHAILGRLALDDGDDLLASREFQAALVRDPEDNDALSGMKRVRGASA